LLRQLDGADYGSEYSPEFAKYMVEGMPNTPYGKDIKDLLGVENCMRERSGLFQVSPS
jgi:glutamate--cysteine ligase catalytic subunit